MAHKPPDHVGEAKTPPDHVGVSESPPDCAGEAKMREETEKPTDLEFLYRKAAKFPSWRGEGRIFY